MHRTTCSLSARVVLLMLALAWCGAASAVPHWRLHLTAPPPSVWHAPDPVSHNMRPTLITPWVNVQVNSGDTLSGLFSRVGLAASQWRALLKLGDSVDALRNLRSGETFHLRKTPDGRLAALHFSLSPANLLVVHRTAHGLAAEIEHLNTTTRHMVANGTVGASFSNSLQRAGTPAPIAAALAHVFDGRVDLSQTISTGDQFSIIYKAQFIDGERVDVGPVIAAVIHTNGRYYRAFRYVGSDNKVHYYDARGRPYEPGLERTPLDYLYVSSPFDRHRKNPVLGTVMPHTGVDLAATRGTPVHAAGDGVVASVGWLGGYGRLVKIEHAMGYSTRYAHLSRYADGLDEGDRVEQGEIIGYVGESGRTTGYHLHFEIRKNGVPHNPLTMKLPTGRPLSGAVLAAFTKRIQPLIARMGEDSTTSPTLLAANTAHPASRACIETDASNWLLALSSPQRDANPLRRMFCAAGA